MKVLLIVLAAFALLVAAVLLLRVKLTIAYRESVLKLGLYLGPICLNGFLTGNKKKKKSKKKSTGTDSGAKQKKPLTDSLGEILEIVKEFTSRFFGHVRVRCARIIITVGNEDPAKTAVRYGALVQAVAYITEILKRNTDFSLSKNALVCIEPDFVTQKNRAEIDITLSVSIGGVIHSLLAAAKAYIFR